MDSYMHKSSQNRINHPAIFVGIHQQENLTCFDPSHIMCSKNIFRGLKHGKKTDLAFANMFEGLYEKWKDMKRTKTKTI